MLSWDIQGLHKHANNNDLLPYLQQYDIVLLCDTWSKYKGEFDGLLHNYSHFDCTRECDLNSIRNSGGVNVFIRDSFCKLNIVRRIYEHVADCVILLFQFSVMFDMPE